MLNKLNITLIIIIESFGWVGRWWELEFGVGESFGVGGVVRWELTPFGSCDCT